MAAYGTNGDTNTNNSKLITNSEKYTNNFDPNEINPLRTGQAKESVDVDSPQVQINVTQSPGIDDADTFVSRNKGTNKFKGTYEAVLTKWDISRKARIPFLITIVLCVLLLIILITMIALWPHIPIHMKEDVCVEKECMESSSQILLWANTTIDVCSNPYAWACGKFEDEYLNRLEPYSFGGEWNTKQYAEYEEISKLHTFIAQMPITVSTSAQSMLKILHSTCMTSETLAKQEADSSLKKAIFSLRGWFYGENYEPKSWDIREAITTIQSKYGVFPFFKLSVENRNSAPFGYIVKISEGEYGLPHKMFYNLGADHKVIKAYKLLLRDFAINFGVVSDSARKFAEEVFHFEQRIVNSLPELREDVILTVSDAQKLAHSLPITEAITTTFPKLNDRTLVLVEDVKILTELSIIVTTSDGIPLNHFIIWSLSRHFLPLMSREYRAALQEFYSTIHGAERSQPSWYFCSKLLINWVPFAIDGFRQNPHLIVATTPITYTTVCKCISIENNGTEVDQTNVDFLNVKRVDFSMSSSTKTASDNPVKYNSNDQKSDLLIQDRINYNHELLKMIFYHLRHQLQRSIDENVSIDQDITNFINKKLSETKLQIGIPSEILKDEAYLNKFYQDFQWRKLHFLDNFESQWAFRKKKMEILLEPMNVTDKTIANLYNLYSVPHDYENLLVQYSIDLNTIIVSNRAVEKPYFHYKYPIAVNFARIGTEISKSFLKAVFFIGTQYKEEIYATHKLVNRTQSDFSLGDTSCLDRKNDPKIPQRAKDALVSDVTSGRFTSKCLKEFLRLTETNQPIPDSKLDDAVTYDLLNLRQRKRQPGLRTFDNMRLFSLVYLQRYCSVTNGYYKPFKAFVEMEVTGEQGFDINWDQIPLLRKSLDCPATTKQCENIL